MTMDCKEVEGLLRSWEEGRNPPEAALKELIGHIVSCASCSAARGGILPLLRLELGREAREEAGPTAPSAAARSLADGVMARLSSLEAKAPASGGRRPTRPVLVLQADMPRRKRVAWPLLATAAAALLVAGLGFGLHFFGPGDGGVVTVRFVLDAPEAKSVYLAGNFSDWKGESLPLERKTPGEAWELTLKLRKDNMYVYNFIVDGERWIVDPSVPETVEDGFGGSSSLLRL